MTGRYLENHFTPEVLEAQEHYYGRSQKITPQAERDLLREEEVAFIAHPEVVAQLVEPAAQRNVERVFLIDVVAFNWNCPKYITPRYTAQEIEELVAPLKARIADLEAKLEGQPK